MGIITHCRNWYYCGTTRKNKADGPKTVEKGKAALSKTVKYFAGVLLSDQTMTMQIETGDGLVLDHSQQVISANDPDSKQIWNMITKQFQKIQHQSSDKTLPWEEISLALAIPIRKTASLRKQLLAEAPKLFSLEMASLVHAALLAAHNGEAGLILSIDTQVIGQSFHESGYSYRIGGWGFPFDQGSSAWIGAQALAHTLSFLDGRNSPQHADSLLHQAILDHCGPTPDKIRDWLATASEKNYCSLAAMVLDIARQGNPEASQIAQKAGEEIAQLALALDKEQVLPLCLHGDFAKLIKAYLPDWLQQRIKEPEGEPIAGAIHLARNKALREVCVEPPLSWSVKPPSKLQNSIEALRPDFDSSVPLYIQLKRKFAQAIQNGIWLPGNTLPSERYLSEALNVSRITIRKTLELLLQDGLVERHQGVGTFVKQRIEQPVSVLTGFSEEMQARGLKPETRVLECTIRPATPDEALNLGLKPGQPVSYLKRLRLADNKPVAVEYSVLPKQFVPNPYLIQGSLYKHLKARKCMPVRALQHLRANIVSSSERDLLEASDDTPVLYITRIGYASDGTAVEYTHSYYRGDRYDFIAELQTDQEQAIGGEMGASQ